MAFGNNVTVVGNLTRDPELRFTNSGMAVLTLGIAVNYKKANSDEEEVSFFDVTAFNGLAENVATSLHKGDRVIADGRLRQSTWETADGDKRSRVEILADDIAPSLRWAEASVTRNQSNGNGRSAAASAPKVEATVGAPADGLDEEPF